MIPLHTYESVADNYDQLDRAFICLQWSTDLFQHQTSMYPFLEREAFLVEEPLGDSSVQSTRSNDIAASNDRRDALYVLLP